MTLTVTCKRFPSQEPWSSDKSQQRSSSVVYRIQQTDTGAAAGVLALITAAQAVMAGNPLPVYGDQWSYDSDTDLDSYAQEFSAVRPNFVDNFKLLDVTVAYKPAESINPGQLSEPDPLLWPTEYWVEWTEEQVVLEEATNVDALTAIGRAALTLGPVVNGCGVEFTEPLMKTVYYPVLHAQKAYETLDEIVALNVTYQNTTNNGSYFGASQRTAKYLGTESGRIQKVQGVSFYMGISRIWFKNATWDRKVLNNGWGHFVAGKLDGDGKPVLFKNKVHDDPQAIDANPAVDPDTPCSEPLNLALDGTLVPKDEPGVYVAYRDLDEVDYAGIGIGS